MSDEKHRFTTPVKQLTRTGELSWGGEDGWGEAFDQQEGVQVKDGKVVPLRIAGRTFLENFADGDVSNWEVTVERSGFQWSASPRSTHSGSHSGYLDAGGRGTATRTFSKTANTGAHVVWVYQTNDPFDDVRLRWQDTNGGSLYSMNFNRETSQNVHVNGDNRGWSFPSNTWVRVVAYNVNFSNGTYDWKIEREDGYVYDSGSGAFDPTLVTGIDRFRINTGHYGRGRGEFYFDDISIGIESP